jgi:hypothetical protein
VKVVLFGSTGMVGQGVLRECLLDPDVEGVLAVVRSAACRSMTNCVKSYTKMSTISRRLRTVSQATTHVSSASASRQSG